MPRNKTNYNLIAVAALALIAIVVFFVRSGGDDKETSSQKRTIGRTESSPRLTPAAKDGIPTAENPYNSPGYWKKDPEEMKALEESRKLELDASRAKFEARKAAGIVTDPWKRVPANEPGRPGQKHLKVPGSDPKAPPSANPTATVPPKP